jgi:hypothetical protein
MQEPAPPHAVDVQLVPSMSVNCVHRLGSPGSAHWPKAAHAASGMSW